MIYVVNYTDPAKTPILVEVGELDKTTSLSLVGKNFTRYGEVFAENFVHLMENFAYDQPPQNPVEGQIWYKSDEQRLKVYDGTQWRGLDEGGNSGAIVKNVYYVSESGNDSNTGESLGESFRTINRALARIAEIDAGSQEFRDPVTIFLKSGTYTVTNPVVVPKNVSIVGDSLRSTNIVPLNKDQDIFWVNNAVYFANVTFRNHVSPSAAIAFPPDGSAGIITTSPYVQNCSSITTTGTGMRVDGNHASGLRSMVVDAFTQYNQGGIGIHMLNRGNTQLVSVFTICCDKAILCEDGGFCSLTNSNSSFGNYALASDGVSSPMYTAKVVTQDAVNIFTLNNINRKPTIGDAVGFANDSNFYTVFETSSLSIGGTEIFSPSYTTQSTTLQDARDTILENLDLFKAETIQYIVNTYPELVFNQFLCSRDVGIIINSIADDMVFGSTYLSTVAGLSYYKNTAEGVIDFQLTETIDAIEFLKARVLSLFNGSTTVTSRIAQNFNIILNILENGKQAAVAPIYTNPETVNAFVVNAKDILIANRNFIVAEGLAYLDTTYPSFVYDPVEYSENIEYIVNALIYDILYFANKETADAADEFYTGGFMEVDLADVPEVSDMFDYLKTISRDILVNTLVTPLNNTVSQVTNLPASNSTQQDRLDALYDIVIELLENGYTVTVTLEEAATETYNAGDNVNFHQYSLITASSHTFEWVGAGIDINTSLPYLGGEAIVENQVLEQNGGKVYFTGTDQRGDFRIGTDFTINRARGTIEGRVFRRSLYGIMTPYILALQE
jgi:hypothetical protein